MKHIAIIIVFLVGVSLTSQAQQIEQYTQYMLNPFVLNPGAVGSEDFSSAKFTYRKQWAGGFNGEEPTTAILSFNGKPSQFQNVGLGAIIFNDVTGPTRRTGLQLAYAYQLPLGATSTKLGLGLAGNILQYSLDVNALILNEDNDPAILGANESKIGGDANIGAFLHDKNYYVGISVAQLFQSKFVFNQDTAGFINLDRHLFAIAGYKYDLSDNLELEPSVLLKSVSAAPVQFDLNARLIYDKRYWLGFNYRTSDAISILAGLTFSDQWHLGYSYDITTSELKTVSSGSHEVMIGFDFGRFESDSYEGKTKSGSGTKF